MSRMPSTSLPAMRGRHRILPLTRRAERKGGNHEATRPARPAHDPGGTRCRYPRRDAGHLRTFLGDDDDAGMPEPAAQAARAKTGERYEGVLRSSRSSTREQAEAPGRKSRRTAIPHIGRNSQPIWTAASASIRDFKHQFRTIEKISRISEHRSFLPA